MKKYIINFNWLFLDKIIRIFGGLFIGIWVARYLGPSDFGVLSYGIAFIAFFSFLSTLGLNSIVVREITKKEDLTNKLLGTTFFLKLFGSMLAFIFGSLIILYLKPDNPNVHYIVVLLLLGYIFQSFDNIDYFFQAKVIGKYTTIARSSAFIVSNILKIYFIMYEYSVVYFAVATMIDFLLASIFLVLIYQKQGFKLSDWKFDIVIAKKLLKDSWPLMLSAFFITIYMKVDQVMIESFLDMESVGLYSVAVRLSEAWYFIPTIMVSTVMPYFVKLRETNREFYLYRLKQINTSMFWMSVVVGLFITFFGKQIIVLLFTDVYQDAYLALSLNIWAGVFISIGLASSLWMISENLQIYRLIGTMIGVILNILANYILIPLYGISGAAIATLVTQGFGLWIVPLFFKPIRGFTIISMVSVIPIYLLKGKR
jgi:PST family polysaccharide transporter